MKVLHVLADLRHSGAERMLACSYEQWRSAGIEPIIVGMSDSGHPYSEALRNAGYTVALLPPVRTVRGLRALHRLLRSVEPDVVHIHSESCFDAVALIAKRTSAVRAVVRTVHSNFAFSGTLRLRRTLRVALARRLGVVWIGCSDEVAQTELSYYKNRIGVVENWVDTDTIRQEATFAARFEMRAALGIDSSSKALALIGNCGGAKNHELVALALQKIASPIHILHVGHRHSESSDEVLAWEDVPPHHTVHHLGPRNDIPRLLAASDLLVFPSLYEGMGLVPAEALCVGLPIIAADTIGLQWLRSTGSARLVGFDVDRWAAAIAGAIKSETVGTERVTLATGAMTDAYQIRFSAERGVRDYTAYYSQALSCTRAVGL